MMSNLQHLAIFMFLVFLPIVISRECYQCLSKHSFRECDHNRVKVECFTSQRCIKASAYATSGVKDEGYVKGCAATCSASDIPICNEPNVKCEVSCCPSDYCNSASAPVVSGLLTVAASLMYLFGF